MSFHKNIISVVGIIIFWFLFSLTGIFNPIYFASPIEVFFEATHMFQSPKIFLDMWVTFYRVFISLLISAVGIPAGILLGYFSKLYDFLGDVLDFFRSIPPIVIYPLLLISLGPGDSSRIGTAIFGSIAVIILIVSSGLFYQEDIRQKFFKSLGTSRILLLKDVVWFEALPHILVALRTSASISLIVIIVTEMLVGGKYGLGSRVQQVQITSNIPDLFVTIIIIGLIGVFLNRIFFYIEKKFIFWKN